MWWGASLELPENGHDLDLAIFRCIRVESAPTIGDENGLLLDHARSTSDWQIVRATSFLRYKAI